MAQPNQHSIDVRVVEERPPAFLSLRLIATEVRWAADSGIVHAQVAILNASNVAVRGPDAIEVWGFAPADVHPLNADCATDVPRSQRCRYEYVGRYSDPNSQLLRLPHAHSAYMLRSDF